jgi:hypothetical protein
MTIATPRRQNQSYIRFELYMTYVLKMLSKSTCMEHSSQIIYFATEAPIRFTTQEERRMGDCLDACLLAS